MNTQNQIGLDFSKNMQLNEINKPDKSETLFLQTGGYNLLDYLITRGEKKVRQTNGRDGEFEVPIIGDHHRVQEVASTSLVSGNLKVNFVDNTFDKFRETELLTDGTAAQNQGRVVSKGAGFVILSPAPPLTSWNTSLHFVAGSFATDIVVATPNRSNSGVESLFQVPKYVKFQTSVSRESLQIYRNDLMQSWIDSQTGFWGLDQFDYMMERFANGLENKSLFTRYGKRLEADGPVNYSQGFFEAVKDPVIGGVYRPLGNVPTYDDFLEWIGTIADRRNEAKTKLKILVARKALGIAQQFEKISEAVKNTGIHNTFGGAEVKGYDVYNYAIEGIECEFIMLPSLNNTSKWRTPTSATSVGKRMQYTFMCVDFEWRPTKDGKIVPAVEKVYFGPREIEMGFIQGVAGTMGLGNSSKEGGNVMAANPSDAVSVEIYSNCAYRWLPYYGGLMELIV